MMMRIFRAAASPNSTRMPLRRIWIMFLIRNARMTALVIGVGVLGGCQQLLQHPGPVATVSNSSIKTDQAMDQREWDFSPTLYANDAVLSHPNYQPLQLPPEPYELNALGEPFLF